MYEETSQRLEVLRTKLDSLRGFLSYMMLYIVQLDFGDPKGIKLRLPLMSRFSFDVLFSQLPPEQQVWLSQHALIVADTIGNVLSGYLTGFSLERPMINVRGVPFAFRQGGHEPFFDLMKTLTVDQWITGILAAGQDRLVASNMKAFLAQMGTDYEQYDKSISIYLRGHANASNLVGKVDDLAIMENRDINPKGDADLSMDETEEISLAYMKFLINLKGAKNKGSVAFPKVKRV